jgi:predicted nucleic-acid-binding Zn-ribbon protein
MAIGLFQQQSARLAFLAAAALCWAPATSYSQSGLRRNSELSVTIDLLNAAIHSKLLKQNIGVVFSTRFCEANQIINSFEKAKNIMDLQNKKLYSENELDICRIFISHFFDVNTNQYVILFKGFDCDDFYDAIIYYLNVIDLKNAIEIGETLKLQGHDQMQLRQNQFISIANELLLDQSKCKSSTQQSKFTVRKEK